MLNGTLFFRTVKKVRLTVFEASWYDINEAIEAKDLQEHPLEEILLEQSHQFLPLLSKVLADQLRLHWPGIAHEGRLKHGETPSWGPLYSMSKAELVVLKEWLEVNMSKEFIRQSSSLFVAPLLFAKKADGDLRFSIDYQDINSKTIKNRYPVPLIKETLNLFGNAFVHTKQDVRGA
jgi:hypothetical protein